MLFFRSEEHVRRWLSQREAGRGAVLTLADTWRLSKAWYPDRRKPAWRPRAIEESQAILDGLGLGPPGFWTLKPAPNRD
jgi:hypothetical protein